jgi:hypothetical protein
MPSRSNIVLLATGSRESTDKARSWGQAARSLGLSVRPAPDQHTVGIIQCSDFKIVEAAWQCRAYNIPGPDPVAATIVSSKVLAGQFLRRAGFEMLFSFVPMAPADLRLDFNGPVIVKPEYGSGTSRLHPWAYGVFDRLADFRRYLARQELTEKFFGHQRAPHPVTGKYFVMEFVQSDQLRYIETLVSDRKVAAYEQRNIWLRNPGMTVETALCGQRFRDVKSVVAMAEAFARIGLRRTFLGMQCMEKQGKLYPIDFQLRPAASIGLLAEKLDLRFFEQALAFMLGWDRDFEFAWPTRAVGVRRVYLPHRRGKYRLKFGEDCIPLQTTVSCSRKAYDDMGTTWGVFGLVCNSKREFLERAERVAASVTARRIA